MTNTIDLYFDEAEEVRASHLLYEDTQNSIQWKGLSKFQFYLILWKDKGNRADGKDKGLLDPSAKGLNGYKLKFVGFKGKKKTT